MTHAGWLLTLWFAFAYADEDFFPLLMPKVRPSLVETYLCTPVRLSDAETHCVIGFKPNATAHTAHHMLVYGCEEPGSDGEVYNCGEMAVKQPGNGTTYVFLVQVRKDERQNVKYKIFRPTIN
jgi:hypothetical protein